jgi:Mg2+ and Co2+ transporter CorA
MEKVTVHMKTIAEKTEKETIFMRIITIVTLFFLPGTFVAVSLLSQTLT